MNKIICLVGPSGCGKSTIAKLAAERYGAKVLKSYTTRPQRDENDTDHIFITQEEYDSNDYDKVAYTYFDNHHYFATRQQIHENDIYILDPIGLKQLYENLDRSNIFSIFISVSSEERLKRMLKSRTEEDALRRLKHDDQVFKYIDKYLYDHFYHNEKVSQKDFIAESLGFLMQSWCKW